MIIDDTYTNLDNRVYLKMNISNLKIIETFDWEEDKNVYDIDLNKKSIFGKYINLDTTGLHHKEILDSVNNIVTVVNSCIIKYNENYYLRTDLNSIIHNIPEFNIKKDITVRDFSEVLEMYADNEREGYYLFSNINGFLKFSKLHGSNFYYNCSKAQYDSFIEDLKEYFNKTYGLFLLYAPIKTYYKEYAK